MPCPSETRLQAFVDGELSPAEIAEVSEHIDACDDCRTIVGAVQPVPLDDESAADRVGRYVLRRVLGKGGMGVVYEAVDPELHRVVALKVLRSDLAGQQKRLLGEAQAMAMLSHPNVVTIHDVGRDGDRVFIVMTLVHGVSLRHWLAREQRSIAEILDAFEQAAEGLRAAHEAGLVHRDFKPENVFVANTARVLVGDFGLAMTGGTETSAAEGSLAYMAPEQKRGEKVDARSDQYSFCLALDEAVRSTPAVPRWLAKLIARGTKADPKERFESMDALLAALRAGRRRSRRRRMALVGATAAAALAALATQLPWRTAHGGRDAAEAVAAQCRARDGDMGAVWNADVAKQVESAFRETKSPLAEGAWRKTSAMLGEYTDAWRSAHRRACEAPPASAALDQRTSCLAERLDMVRAVTARLAHVDGPMLEQVPAMLQLLPRIDACEDAEQIAQRAPRPSADKAAAVEATRKKIAAASATIVAGRYAEGLGLADDALGSASAAAYLPVIAEAYLWVGTAHGRLGHTEKAQEALEQAVSSASAGHAPAVAIRAWIALMHFVGDEGKRYADGARWGDYAKAALESMPGAYDLEAERLSWSRAMLLDQRRFDEALVVSRQELALVEVRFGAQHRLTAAALDGLASVLAGECKARDAIEPQERACAVLEKEYGSPHPQLALCLGNLAALHADLGEHERAIVLKQRALAMFEQMPGHPNHVAMTHRNMVRSLLELGRLAEAKAELEKAAAMSHGDADETRILLLRAELHRREGKTAASIAEYTQAVGRTEHAPTFRRVDPLLSLADAELAAKRWSDAAAHAELAAKLVETVYGERSCRLADPLRARAEALLGGGRASEAVPLAERAVALAQAAQTDPIVVTRARDVLARASK